MRCGGPGQYEPLEPGVDPGELVGRELGAILRGFRQTTVVVSHAQDKRVQAFDLLAEGARQARAIDGRQLSIDDGARDLRTLRLGIGQSRSPIEAGQGRHPTAGDETGERDAGGGIQGRDQDQGRLVGKDWHRRTG